MVLQTDFIHSLRKTIRISMGTNKRSGEQKINHQKSLWKLEWTGGQKTSAWGKNVGTRKIFWDWGKVFDICAQKNINDRFKIERHRGATDLPHLPLLGHLAPPPDRRQPRGRGPTHRGAGSGRGPAPPRPSAPARTPGRRRTSRFPSPPRGRTACGVSAERLQSDVVVILCGLGLVAVSIQVEHDTLARLRSQAKQA